MDITQVATELTAYFQMQQLELRKFIYLQRKTAQYMTPIMKIKGNWPATHSIMDDVIQPFTTTWNALGNPTFKTNILQNYRVKVNLPIIPDQIEGTWAAWANQNDRPLQQRSISDYIMTQMLMPKLAANQEKIWGKGDTGSGEITLQSMNGLVKIISQGIQSANFPMLQIALDDTFTAQNMYDNVVAFEKAMPEIFQDIDMPIIMSSINARLYREDVAATMRINPSFENVELTTSFLTGRKIVGLPSLNGSNYIFCTPAGNLLRLLDDGNDNVVRDIQVLDYTIKIFIDYWDGIGFWTNQMVIVGVPGGNIAMGYSAGSGSGLHNTDTETLYLGD